MDFQQPKTNKVIGSSLKVSIRRETSITSKEKIMRMIQVLARIKLKEGRRDKRFDTQSSLYHFVFHKNKKTLSRILLKKVWKIWLMVRVSLS